MTRVILNRSIMVRRMRPALWLCCLLVVGIAPVSAGGFNRQALVVGDTLPDVPLKGLNGPSGRLSMFRGRPLIINVWASWCGPCRREMASLERLAWQYPDGFNVIGISTDDHAESARAFLIQSGATVSHYIDERLRLEKLLGAERLPLTVLVDARGRVVRKIFGAREWDSEQALTVIGGLFGHEKPQKKRRCENANPFQKHTGECSSAPSEGESKEA